MKLITALAILLYTIKVYATPSSIRGYPPHNESDTTNIDELLDGIPPDDPTDTERIFSAELPPWQPPSHRDVEEGVSSNSYIPLCPIKLKRNFKKEGKEADQSIVGLSLVFRDAS